VLLTGIAEARYKQGRLLGRMHALGLDAQLEAELTAASEDAVKTSAIEGEVLNPASVRSSIARRLGMDLGGVAPTDQRVEGVVDVVLDATRNFTRLLTPERIFGWHAALFPTGYSGLHKIDVGRWRSDRDGPMQVVSAHAVRPRVHFEAPPAGHLNREMSRFLAWFNGAAGMDPLLRAGLAHLWFVTIHPLDDGNGRIARAITDLAVARMERTGQRFYSLSSQIEREKRGYYEVLEATQKGTLDVTAWLMWFVGCYAQAIDTAEATAARVTAKASFWTVHAGRTFSDRQRKVLGRLLDDFEGAITARKWASLCSCSPDTAQRDIGELVQQGLLVKNPGGSKRTSYRFNWPPE